MFHKLTGAAWVAGLLVVGSASSVALAQGQPQACPQCDSPLVVSAAEWECLMARRDQLAREQTPVRFFRLDAVTCAPYATRDIGPRLPRESETAPRVFRLSRDQLRCLQSNYGRVQRQGGSYRFDFERICPAS